MLNESLILRRFGDKLCNRNWLCGLDTRALAGKERHQHVPEGGVLGDQQPFKNRVLNDGA